MKRGIILITVVGVVSVITILVLALLQNSLATLNFAERQVKNIVALNAAETGISTAIYSLEENYSGSSISGVVTEEPPVEYRVEIENNLSGSSPSGDVPPYAVKLTSTGYINKGNPGEFRRIVAVVLRLRSLNLGMVSSGLIDLGQASSVYLSAVSGHSGNIHSNYSGDENGNGIIDSGENNSFNCVDILHQSWGDYPPYYYITGEVTTPGYIHTNIKDGTGGRFQEGPGVSPIDIPEWDIDTLTADMGTAVPVTSGTYKVEDNKLKKYNDSGVLQDGDVIQSILELVEMVYGAESELYNVIPTAIVCTGNTMKVDIPEGCTCLDSVTLQCLGDMKVENSNFECHDKIEIIVKESDPDTGNLSVKNTNFGGKATLIVEGKLTFEGYSDIEGSDSDGLAMYAGKGMELHMKEGYNPIKGYNSTYHNYRGVIYSGGPIDLYNEGVSGLSVEGAVVANNSEDPNNAYIKFHQGAGYDNEYIYLGFRYNPDYTRDLIVTPDSDSVPGETTETRFDRVFWHTY